MALTNRFAPTSRDLRHGGVEHARLAGSSCSLWELYLTIYLLVEYKSGNRLEKVSLFYNYPNPFNPLTTIRFGLPNAEEVLLEVCNIHGQLVATLIDSYLDDGYHEVKFNGSQLSSGVYIYKLRAGEFTSIKRMVLVK